MSTNDPEFYQAPKFTPEPPQALPRQRGCFFYGCIIASILAVLIVILLAVVAFFGYRIVESSWSTSTPPPRRESFPRSRCRRSSARRSRTESRRSKAVEAGTPTEPLVLTSDDLNALIEENPDFKGKIYVKIEGDEVKGQVSIPLDRLGFGHGPGPLLERRSRSQGVAHRRRAHRHARLDRGKRSKASRRDHERAFASRTWPKTPTRTRRTPR